MTDPKATATRIEGLDTYDAGLLNDFGGGDVDWWQNYIRLLLADADEHYRQRHDATNAEKDKRIADLEGALKQIVNGWDATKQQLRDHADAALKGSRNDG